MLFDSFEAYDVQETRRISRKEGKIEGRIEDILELLEYIADIPSSLKERIQSETDLNVLKKWITFAARCETIEEFREKAEL